MTMSPLLDYAKNTGLISAEDLFTVLQSNPERVKLVDATYPSNPSLPGIANAVTFDIDDIADPDSPMAHMLPSPGIFAAKIGAIGIGNDDFVICYDQSGFIMAASRAWWMFRVFGHNNVAVLDGGLINWIQKNYPVHLKNHAVEPKEFNASYRPELVVSYEEMHKISSAKEKQIIDARPPERFVDHIPNSLNLPALSLFNPDRTMISPDDFKSQLERENIAPDSPLIATCGSGVTACALALALFREGRPNVAVYDGSWTEWSMLNK